MWKTLRCAWLPPRLDLCGHLSLYMIHNGFFFRKWIVFYVAAWQRRDINVAFASFWFRCTYMVYVSNKGFFWNCILFYASASQRRDINVDAALFLDDQSFSRMMNIVHHHNKIIQPSQPASQGKPTPGWLDWWCRWWQVMSTCCHIFYN